MERAVVPDGSHRALTDDDLRALVTTAPAVSYIEDADGNGIFVSPQIEAMLGYPVEEWLAVPHMWERLLHPEDRGWVIAADRKASGAGDTFALEYRMIAKDGSSVWIRDDARPEVDEQGNVVRWHGVLWDLTALHAAERRASEAELWFQRVVEHSPIVLYVELGDGTGRVPKTVYLGPRVQDLTRYTSAELAADPLLFMSRIHPDDAEQIRAEDARTDATGETWDCEYRFLTRDDRQIWVHDHAELVEGDPSGRMVWYGYLTDVTHTKEVESDLQTTIEMLRKADSHRRQLFTRLVSIQEEERAQIARDIHDDPIQKMTALALRLQLLDSVLDDEAQRERLRDALDVVSMTTRSLRRLLFDLSPPALQREGLAAAVRECVAQHSDELEARVEVKDLLPFEAPAHVRTTAFQVVREALANIRKHSRAEQVEIVLEARDRGLHITVRDDGQGFEPNTVAWEPGHLGLGSMRDRAELAGGRVDVRSDPGQGTTVELWLPVDGSNAEQR